jgi:hypothetical protein
MPVRNRTALLLALAAAAFGCASGIEMQADHQGGAVRFRTGSGQEARHEDALARALEHCRAQGFDAYSVTREFDEDGRRSIDFSCRN